jgi:hypothetical protein
VGAAGLLGFGFEGGEGFHGGGRWKFKLGAGRSWHGLRRDAAATR